MVHLLITLADEGPPRRTPPKAGFRDMMGDSPSDTDAETLTVSKKGFALLPLATMTEGPSWRQRVEEMRNSQCEYLNSDLIWALHRKLAKQ